MSGLPNMMSGGADCSTGNPLDGITKQFNKDRSLEQNRFGPDHAVGNAPQNAFRQAMRNAQNRGPQPADALAREFLGGGAMHKQPENFRPDAFSFEEFNRELSKGPAIAGPRGPPGGWANEFAHSRPAVPQGVEFSEMSSAFNRAMVSRPGMGVAMNSSFQQQTNISAPVNVEKEAMDKAFGQARIAANMYMQSNYMMPMYGAQVGLVRSDINNEKIQEEASKEVEEDDEMGNSNELTEAAQRFIEATSGYAGNENFSKSEFLTFIHKLRDGDINIQGSRVIEVNNTATASTGKSAEEVKASSWSESFIKEVQEIEAREKGISDKADGNIFKPEVAQSIEKNWSEEFEKSLDGPLKETFVAGSMEDWEEEFAKHENEISIGDPESVGFDEMDWVSQYRNNVDKLRTESDDQWDQMKKEWDNTLENSYRATDIKYDTYGFASANPFANNSQQELDRLLAQIKNDPASISLKDTIMSLESMLKNDPQNATLWTMLGVKQQENERDDAAIAALRKAISIDPNSLDAYIALAVSYGNENYQVDSYVSLHEWISRHPKYKDIVPADSSLKVSDPKSRKEYLQDLYLKAIRMQPGSDWDPDLQISFGIFLSISGDYDKAIDCFKAALSKRPDDYMLWNKLGATLANSQKHTAATEAYFRALELQPSYIRAIFNMSIASINMQHYSEAATHLLSALALQADNDSMIQTNFGSNSDGFVPALSMSSSLWDTLKMVMYMLNESSLAEACEGRDITPFRAKFDF
ncbi:Peroxisomal targeting signal 1 receptor [Zancudomyces culisetae]|uniref:Peroxisomal targeting signal 1 receptor n=1 Tax=Zancudomyces culisetae TaxID=1213189 RepID=A0A1R1PUU5_ZANCU|nr:Peroxisomal targeting signal 1 receptor [Zancudomyces culisetae]|eukprot:OMH84689.1 Peroxisomal targeting signal 1 receptor [Zancudomyces culisetae]